MYKKVSTDLDFKTRELEILDLWNEKEVFEKSIESRKNCPTFTFYDGPPTANGKPHIGHILTRVFKDIVPRYKTMKGYKVLRKAGWDTHGLPVELGIEKQLGISGKSDIEDFGVEPFVKKCKESVWTYEKEWKKMSERVGYWADMENPYVTYHNNYIESVWWALKKVWDKDLLYKGHKIVPYCPRCGTSLSSHEVAQGYKDVKEESIYVKFKAKAEDNLYFMAWTTTPWTLPSNVALTVNPKEAYVKIESNRTKYIMAKALLDNVLEDEYKILSECTGQDLEKMEYEPLYKFIETKQKSHYIACADFVTLTDGTGIVHTAPAFGDDDAKVGTKYDLPFVQMVNDEGKFIEEATPWKGVFVKDADPEIVKELTERGLVYKALDYEHSYPFCWRCDTPLLYYARNTWFIKMSSVRDQLIKNNNKINWMPDTIGKNRFGDWIENVIDWGISRERYWGTPLPIWECECGHKHLIGSIKELQEMADNVPDDIELHKPYIDNVQLNCPKCTSKMTRVTEVIDCWFDSGSMPFAQWHYPFENEEIFKDNFPADYISEAVDQTRGWFYTLLAISTLLFDEPAFKNVIVLGHVNDKQGKKMSKNVGNVVDPWSILDNQGADAVRWYFCVNSAPWLPSSFHADAVSEVQRKFMGTLWNTYYFYVLYADIDKFDPTKYKLEHDKLNVIDKWVLSKLNILIKTVDDNLENYKITESTRVIQDFVDELSNWYVRRSRERFWGSDMSQDKINAFMTLHTVLTTLTKLIAPFTPFLAESIYQNIVAGIDDKAPSSVHFCDFPKYDDSVIDEDLEVNMKRLLKVVQHGRACRNNANIKNKQPLPTLFVKTDFELPGFFKNLVLEELNVKDLEYIKDDGIFIQYIIKPDRKTVGPKYGKLLSQIIEELKKINANEAVKQFELGKSINLTINDQEVILEKNDVLIETSSKEGYISSSDNEISVVLDTNLTDKLIEEGFVRELISKIQTMRKEADFEIMDNINVYYEGSEKVLNILKSNLEFVSKEVLASSFKFETVKGYTKNWKINGEDIKLGVERAV